VHRRYSAGRVHAFEVELWGRNCNKIRSNPFAVTVSRLSAYRRADCARQLPVNQINCFQFLALILQTRAHATSLFACAETSVDQKEEGIIVLFTRWRSRLYGCLQSLSIPSDSGSMLRSLACGKVSLQMDAVAHVCARRNNTEVQTTAFDRFASL
jgi:hypothetical protein